MVKESKNRIMVVLTYIRSFRNRVVECHKYLRIFLNMIIPRLVSNSKNKAKRYHSIVYEVRQSTAHPYALAQKRVLLTIFDICILFLYCPINNTGQEITIQKLDFLKYINIT